MKFVFVALAVLFGALHALAGASQVKKKDQRPTALGMLTGGLLMLLAAALCLLNQRLDWLLSACGAVLIAGCAIRNGQSQGKLHPSHHGIRGAFALAIIVGFCFY